MKIIVGGKGGSGKSTIVVLLARVAVDRGYKVLVVDADESNTGLQRMLGVEELGPSMIEMVGGRRDVFDNAELLRRVVESVLSFLKVRTLSLTRVGKIDAAGSGCGCPMGAATRELLSSPLEAGSVMLVDAEAGIEHFGRGVDKGADLILFVTDPCYDGIELCEKAKKMADDIGVKFYAVLNKIDSDETKSFLESELKRKGVQVVGAIPYDIRAYRSSLHGQVLEAGTALQAINRIVDIVLDGRLKTQA